jgi:hypothetical protein
MLKVMTASALALSLKTRAYELRLVFQNTKRSLLAETVASWQESKLEPVRLLAGPLVQLI